MKHKNNKTIIRLVFIYYIISICYSSIGFCGRLPFLRLINTDQMGITVFATLLHNSDDYITWSEYKASSTVVHVQYDRHAVYLFTALQCVMMMSKQWRDMLVLPRFP